MKETGHYLIIRDRLFYTFVKKIHDCIIKNNLYTTRQKFATIVLYTDLINTTLILAMSDARSRHLKCFHEELIKTFLE